MAQIHGGFPPQGVMPPNAHMGHMPTPGPNMHPTGQMHPQMHPSMRATGMQHPGQSGPLMGHPSMGMTPNGMNHGMGPMQPGQHQGMYGGHPQMGPSFQQMPQGGGMTPQQQQHQQAMMARARMQQMQQNNPNMMMSGGQGPQMAGHPGMMKAPLPPNQMHQMRMQHAAQQQMANQTMHGGHPNTMQRQPSVQGLREQGPGGHQQHPGQQHPQTSMPPPTPHNAQMQRGRPPGQPGAPPNHNQHQQQQPTPQIPQNQQQPPQGPLDQQGPPHHTPQTMHTPVPPGSGQPQHQQRPQQAPPQGQPPPQQAGPPGGQSNQQQPPPQPQQGRENEQQFRQNPPNMAQIRAQMQARQMNQQQMNQQIIQQNNNNILAKLQSFCFQFNQIAAGDDRANLNAWQGLVLDFFVPHGSFKKLVYNHADQNSTVEHEIAVAVLARYFWTFYVVSGVTKIQMALGAGSYAVNAKLFRSFNDPFCSFTYYFPDGSQQVANGSVSLQLYPGGEKIFSMDFINVTHEEFISRQVLDDMAFDDFKQSPEKSKSSSKQKQARGGQRIISVSNLPRSRCGEYGMPKGVQDFLEKVDTLSRMRAIMDYHTQKAPAKRPREALDQLLAQPPNQLNEALYAPQPLNPLANPGMQMPMLHGNGQGAMPQQQQAQVNGPMRTPGLNGMPPNGHYFPSPANGHLGLLNHASPHMAHHTPPPGQVHGMQAPPMMAQGSQHGMGQSMNGSTNASPNMTGKRRRQSLAGKMETGDEGMGPPPPTSGQGKVKQSPGLARPGKKQKAS